MPQVNVYISPIVDKNIDRLAKEKNETKADFLVRFLQETFGGADEQFDAEVEKLQDIKGE